MKLEIGYKHGFEIRREVCEHNAIVGLSIVYISDLHFNGYSEFMLHELEQAITIIDPKIIILGGDYVDTNQGLNYFKQLLMFLSHRNNIFVIPGNHDYFFGIQKIRTVVEQSGCTWLEKETVVCVIDTITVQVSNTPECYDKTADLRILCVHKPIDMNEVTAKYHLIFAGHLHGCQFVFWETLKGLYPGRFFYKWNRIKHYIGNTLYLISKGVGDTLPIRYNCKKDIICVTFSSRKEL